MSMISHQFLLMIVEISSQMKSIHHDVLIWWKTLHKKPKYFLANCISLTEIKDEPLDSRCALPFDPAWLNSLWEITFPSQEQKQLLQYSNLNHRFAKMLNMNNIFLLFILNPNRILLLSKRCDKLFPTKLLNCNMENR